MQVSADSVLSKPLQHTLLLDLKAFTISLSHGAPHYVDSTSARKMDNLETFNTFQDNVYRGSYMSVHVLLKLINELWKSYSVVRLLCFCARLCFVALWSPAGKGLTSWFSFVMYNCEFVTFPLVSWISVILDCIDSLSLPSFLLCRAF